MHCPQRYWVVQSFTNIFRYCTNIVDLKALNLHGVSPTMLILSESTQNVHHFCTSPITTVFIVEKIRPRVIKFYPDLRLS